MLGVSPSRMLVLLQPESGFSCVTRHVFHFTRCLSCLDNRGKFITLLKPVSMLLKICWNIHNLLKLLNLEVGILFSVVSENAEHYKN